MEYKGLMIRRALPEDHRSVINIRDIYDGADYLDSVYPFYMTSENVHGFVAEKDGVIIGFICFHVVDGGKSFVTGSNRIHPAYEGHNYANMLIINALKQVLDDSVITAASTNLVTGIWAEVHKRRFGKKSGFYRNVLLKKIRSYGFRLGHLQQGLAAQGLVQTFSKEDIWRPSEGELHQMLFCDEDFKNLIPNMTFIADWSPFTLMPDNFEDIWKTIIPHVSGSKKFSTWKALSVFRENPCKLGARVNVHFYGRTSDQLMLHVGSILRYLASGQSFTDPDICISFTVIIPEEIPIKELENLAVKGGWEPRPLDGVDSMFLAETNWGDRMEGLPESKL